MSIRIRYGRAARLEWAAVRAVLKKSCSVCSLLLRGLTLNRTGLPRRACRERFVHGDVVGSFPSSDKLLGFLGSGNVSGDIMESYYGRKLSSSPR